MTNISPIGSVKAVTSISSIGNVKPDSPFLLAPLAGVTDSTYRRLCREQGAAMVYSEMVSANGLYYNDRKTEELLRFYDEEKPVAFQIFGKDPDRMAMAADRLNDRENVLLDVNMGCPVAKVVKNGEGSALLKEPKLAGQIIKAMARVSVKPITVKIRIGWDSGSINAVEMAKVLEDAGAAAIAVHGRTREQFYSGKADWDMIRRVKEAVTIPVIGNGDVLSGADAVRMLAVTSCDYVMIARGALGNPWIFRDALVYWDHYSKMRCFGLESSSSEREAAMVNASSPTADVSLDEKLHMIRRHFNMLISEIGEYRAIREMRKHTAWYLKGVRGSAEIKRRINSLTDSGDFFRTIDDFAALHRITANSHRPSAMLSDNDT